MKWEVSTVRAFSVNGYDCGQEKEKKNVIARE